ncbi:DUF1127 domain-containing protein [Roseomonas sp. SSH11]|uniref:DUF1127 domain-containing protein n=1 Tax=Pararoseomonas baculiformis TaxID=2820812 RepID=A0ABS4AEZ4_9PROT|nr:DUF1127 domain-containing protein [Pararoseomonas baculiformis]MBP0445561.1 DUF1127 domain-containing protein [Pararoseomonas baculiformis]
MNPRISQVQHPAPMMPFPANAQPMSQIEVLRQANEARNAVITSGLQRLVSGFAAWIQRRRAEAELTALTDRELADIGLTRGDIPFVLQGGIERRESSAPRAATTPVPAAANDPFRKRAAA